MSTKFTFNPAVKPPLAQLRDLIKQNLIRENQGGSTGDPNLTDARAAYLGCLETWPASCAIAAALLANDNTFTIATMAAFGDTNAP